MRRIGIIGDIGSGKTFVAKNFGYPVFNADEEVAKLYKKSRKVFTKLKKVLPKYIYTFPISKSELSKAILADKVNLKRIVKVIHLEVRMKMNNFIYKNNKKEFIILDIPLLLENKINKKKDILVFVSSKKKDILKRLRKRNNYNVLLVNRLRNLQLPLDYKKKKSQFIIKNNFTKKSVNKSINKILKIIKK
ncbi:dephospho-CoA kinase [Candidatus Pelagibacter sp.]|nr:dephospho-CoA kinase [Candidatus Pelagibacter sp.]